jgi:hypothetical protein
MTPAMKRREFLSLLGGAVLDALTNLNRKRVYEFAAAKRLPAIYEYDFLVRDGGLMSYGSDLTESFERAAALADRIFKAPSRATCRSSSRPAILSCLTLRPPGRRGWRFPRICWLWPTK